MQKFGIINNGELLLSDSMLPDYKPVKYAEIPSDFNQETQYITQSESVDEGEHIFVGIDIHELDLDDNVDLEPPIE